MEEKFKINILYDALGEIRKEFIQYSILHTLVDACNVLDFFSFILVL